MAADVANATGGVLVGQNAHLTGANFDSRTISPGQLFVPIVAERDGHQFIADALKAGAGAYLTSQEPVGRSAIVVDDTLSALLKFGAWAREKLSLLPRCQVSLLCVQIRNRLTTTKVYRSPS